VSWQPERETSLIVLGGAFSGRTSTLTTLSAGYAALHPDRPRSLVSMTPSDLPSVVGGWSGISDSPATAQTLILNLATEVSASRELGPRLVVIDVEASATSGALADALLALVREAPAAGWSIVAASSPDRIDTARTWLNHLKGTSTTLLLQPDASALRAFGQPAVPADTRRLPGRGLRIDRAGTTTVVQVCSPPAPRSAGKVQDVDDLAP
jgi:hypothetical protein